MKLKSRSHPLELMIYSCLNSRMDIAAKEKSHYMNLVKSCEGEKRFDDLHLANAGERIILNDLLFEANKTFYQMDSLFLPTQTIYLFEVKKL